VDLFASRPSVESQKLEVLRRIMKSDAVKRELLTCLSDGLWHTTTELARRARTRNAVVGLVTVGSMLARMRQQLGEDFLEQMVQSKDEGVASWRLGMAWLDVVREVVRQTEGDKEGEGSVNLHAGLRGDLPNSQPT